MTFGPNSHFTLKTKTLKRSDLDDFVAAYTPEARHRSKMHLICRHRT
jgi:hypothetical protein